MRQLSQRNHKKKERTESFHPSVADHNRWKGLSKTLVSFLLVRLALANFIGATFTCRQVLTETTTFRGCELSSKSDVLSLSNSSVSL
jgi:hypothetical protein